MTNEQAFKLAQKRWGEDPGASFEIEFLKNRHHHFTIITYLIGNNHYSGMGKNLERAFADAYKRQCEKL
jgi:hypothetical protein